ncbi:MAG: hypothetical protein IID53_08600, partial [Proteobacteria bacterium]|nr:hypothetical protein [Pseudomonadota bacterium]
AKMTYIGSIVPVNPVIVVRRQSKAKSIEALKKTEIAIACSGRGSQSYIMPAMLKYFIGFKWKLICGYKGSAPMTLALQRGEVDAQSSAWISWKIRHFDAIQNGDLKPIVQVGLKREADLPDLPLMQDLTEDAEIKRILEFVSSGSAIGRSIIAGPGTPKDRIAALRKAFDKTVKDPKLLAFAKKRNAIIDPKPGAEVQKIALRALNTPKELVERARAATKGKTEKCQKNCKKKKKKKKKS